MCQPGTGEHSHLVVRVGGQANDDFAGLVRAGVDAKGRIPEAKGSGGVARSCERCWLFPFCACRVVGG